MLGAASYEGATALAPSLAPDSHAKVDIAEAASPSQPALWAQKVIPFTEIQRHAGIVPTAAPKPAARRGSRPVAAAQEYFDFVPTAAPRTLKDTVEAQVYCDLPVATPTHRFVAGIMDAAMIAIGFGLFVAVANLAAQMAGVEDIFGSGKILLETLGAALAAIAVLYGTIWVIAERETAGMKWSDLQLVTFDGFALDRKHRAGRFLTTILSFCSGGLGLLWALADAENLTWHDQISRTFPTVRSRSGSFVKQSRHR